MRRYQRKVFVSDTDFSGFLYFTRLQDIALEAFTTFLGKRIFESPYLFPIVRAEADYKTPVKVGQTLIATIEGVELGNTSVTYKAKIEDESKKIVGCVSITHVCVSREIGSKEALPESLRKVLASLGKPEARALHS